MSTATRTDAPETMAQARRWEMTKGRYLAAGLCDRCSAQAAFGHQLGFARVIPPCPVCAPVVERFPVAAVNGWRKGPGKARGGVLPLVWASAGTPTPRGAEARNESAQSGHILADVNPTAPRVAA